MKEESKRPASLSQQTSEADQLKARLNNNLPYQRAQAQVFSNISRLDRLIAYSVAAGDCPSLARVKQTQVRSLLKKFSESNTKVAGEQEEVRLKLFKRIIRNRFNARGGAAEEEGEDEEMPEEEQEEPNEGEDDYDHEDDSEISSAGIRSENLAR